MKNVLKYGLITIVFIITLLVASLNFAAISKKEIEPANTTKVYYMLKEFKGKIAVFKGTDSAPIEILDVYIEHLPVFDRQRLQKGIIVDNQAELDRLIEDYDG